jgi:hypothetical protein
MPEILLENLRRMKKGCGRTVSAAPAQATSNARASPQRTKPVSLSPSASTSTRQIRLTPLALSFLILASG